MSKLVTITNQDPSFYPLLGPWLTRREVHRRLGGVPWDDDGKTWIVAVGDDGEVEGFIGYSSRRGQAAALLESGFAVDPDSEETLLGKLARAAVTAVAPSPVRSTVRKHLERAYTRVGFEVLDRTDGFIKVLHSGKKTRGAR